MQDSTRTKAQLLDELTEMRRRAAELDSVTVERDLVAEALRAREAQLVDILNIAHEAIISINQSQQIILFNRGAENIFGYTADEIIGQSMDVLLPNPVTKIHQKHIDTFATAPESARLMGQRSEIVGRRKNGETFPAEASISKLTGDQTIFTVVLRDITIRRRAETEREQLIEQLRALNEAARAITAELSLDQALQKIAEVARELMKVKSAALSVHDEQGQPDRVIVAPSPIDADSGAVSGSNGHSLINITADNDSLLSPLLQNGESIIVNDGQRLLGVPIHAKGRQIGALLLADKLDGSPFTPADQQLVERLALHAAIGIENASLYEQTQRLAILEERERFARDLHDGIIQSIYAVGLVLDQTKADIPAEHEAAAEQIDLTLKSLATVIQDIRNYIFDLRPQAIKNQGLKSRLEGLIKEIRANTLLPIDVQIDSDINTHLSERQANHIFHICHEALSNAVRHASPSRIAMSLMQTDGTVTLTVQDDGIGFKPPSAVKPGHRGLANINSRALQLDAKLTIDSTPGEGTCLTVTFKGV